MEREMIPLLFMSSVKSTKKQDERIQLLKTIGSLQKLADEHNVALQVPKLFVVGSQSRGKSSLVEAMAGLTFNFCANDIASRFPINFTMINDSNFPMPSWTLITKDKRFSKLTTETVSSRVATRNMELQQQNTVSDEPMDLELRWANCPNLSFMDLPGLRAFAVDEGEAKLKAQIENMVQNIINQYAKSSNVYFLVVEDAKEDMANYHGLSHIGRMLATAYQGQPSKQEEIPDIDDMDENIDLLVKEEPEETFDSNNRFFLVLNKFDNFLNSQDLSHTDKTKKIETVIGKFQSKGIPVFFTSLPNTAEKSTFDRARNSSADREMTMEERELVVCENFGRSLEEHSQTDLEAMGNLLDDYRGPVGFLSLKDYVENMMMNQYRFSLPKIHSILIAKKQELEEASGLGDTESQQFMQQHLSSICSRFSSLIEAILIHDLQDSKIVIQRQSLDDEYSQLQLPVGAPTCFSYQKSPVWRNKKFNKELREVMYADIPLFGGAQINRLITEFQICIHCIRGPGLNGADFKAKVIEMRTSVNRQIGGGPTDWSVIIGKLLQESCSELLGDDIAFFTIRLIAIMNSWFDCAWNAASGGYSDTPPRLKEELRIHYSSLVERWCSKMASRMKDFVQYSIRDYNPEAFQHRLMTQKPTTLYSPAASHIFTSIMEQIAPGRNDLSASSLLESSICSAEVKANPNSFENDSYDLYLGMHDRPEDTIVLEKLRTICAYQVKFGSEKIKETFKFLFECLFKRPLCTKLPQKLIDWSGKLPQTLRDRMKQDNILLQDIDTNIALVSKIMPSSTIFSNK